MVSLDKQGFSNKVSRIPAFVIDQNDNPVAIYSDLENGGSISVIKYEKPVFDSYSLTVDEDSGATSLFKSLKTVDEEGDGLTLTVTLGNSTSGELTGIASSGATLNYSSETATLTLSGSLA